MLEGHTRRSAYHTFPIEQFHADRQRFEVNIGDNLFTRENLHLALDRAGPLGKLQGQLSFEGEEPWPVRWYSPGIMGWYAWVPSMECYHGVLSFDHSLHGVLEVEGESLSFQVGGVISKRIGARRSRLAISGSKATISILPGSA